MAIDAGKAWLAFATDAPAPRPTKGAAAAARDGVVVVAPSAADLRASLDGARGARRRATPAPPSTSASPACPPTPAPASPSTRRALLAQRSAASSPTPPGAARCRDGAAVLRHARRAAARALPRHRATRWTSSPPTCRSPPARSRRRRAARAAHGRASATPRRRSPSPAKPGCSASSTCSTSSPGFLKPDLSDLGPNGTITSPGLDLQGHLTARFEPPDPGDWATKLTRIDTLAGLAGKSLLDGLSIDRKDGAYTITQDGALVARAGVYGRALVLSNDPTADLRAAAAAPAAPTPPGAAGALTARLRSSVLATQIPDLIRARVGDLTAWARAELTGVTGELRLALR